MNVDQQYVHDLEAENERLRDYLAKRQDVTNRMIEYAEKMDDNNLTPNRHAQLFYEFQTAARAFLKAEYPNDKTSG